MKYLIIGLMCMGCSQTSPELLAALEQNTAAVKKLSAPAQTAATAEPENIIVDYQIVKTSSAEKLQGEVKTLMKEGWQPLGGHQYAVRYWRSMGSIKTRVHQNYYQQTMVKYGRPKEK